MPNDPPHSLAPGGSASGSERACAPRVAVVGAPGAGKTRLIDALASASAGGGDREFVFADLPSVSPAHVDDRIPRAVREADLALVVVDLSGADPLEQVRGTLDALEAHGVRLVPDRPGSETDGPLVLRRALFVATKADRPEAGESRRALEETYTDRLALHVVSAETGLGLDDLLAALRAAATARA